VIWKLAASMQIDPDLLLAKPRSRVLEYLHYQNEQTLYDNWRAEEAAWRASRRVN
jgi:hypothetical protein